LLRRQLLPVAVAIGVGLVVLSQQFITNATLDTIVSALVSWTAILAAFALLVGLANAGLFHLRRIKHREPQAYSSLIILVTAVVVFVIVLPSGGAGSASRWIVEYIYRPLEGAFLALVVFFLASAAYRALRVRTFEMTLFAVAAVIALVGATPAASAALPIFSEAREWLLTVPALAGVRGIALGVALGVIATGLRLLSGIDRPYSE
jgi:hypothetical protein